MFSKTINALLCSLERMVRRLCARIARRKKARLQNWIPRPLLPLEDGEAGGEEPEMFQTEPRNGSNDEMSHSAGSGATETPKGN